VREPERWVDVDAFEMDATEVTVAQYAACASAGACPPAPTTVCVALPGGGTRTLASAQCNADRADRSHHPVNCTDWSMAAAYCRWAGERLPTDEEWEYAARGEASVEFPWGNVAPTAAAYACWSLGRSRDGTCPVGSFSAGDSPFGLHDMVGGVAEWTATAPSHTEFFLSGHPDVRIVRGGSWGTRDWPDLSPVLPEPRIGHDRSSFVGFRCAR
jgi:formylglycine-generating enzyme required for sulfatase activity